MRLSTSYKQILSLSVPIMLGSAAQNIIVLCDNVFLYHYDQLEFAAAGLVGVFYLIIASIGYGFSRGGQILIARRNGELNYAGAGRDFQGLFIFECILAVVLFLLIYFGSASFFSLFIKNQEILEKCVEYIKPRSFGIFFSYIGVSLIAFYTGIANTKFIIYDTIILILVNIVLNYIFIFGAFGIEPMGIAGAGLASTLAEVVAFIAFVTYMIWDKGNRKYKLLNTEKLSVLSIFNVFNISFPVVFQSILGIGSWFLFFSFIENVGSQELQISNLMRNVYLILSIPCWGYSAGINTMVSNFIGNKKRQAVFPIIVKTAKLNVFSTILISLPVLLFPEFFLYPLFGRDDMSLIIAAKPYMMMVFAILMTFSVGGIFINGLIGTGHTRTALMIQLLFTVIYIIYSIIFIKFRYYNLNVAWGVEILYWAGIAVWSILFLKTDKWHFMKF